MLVAKSEVKTCVHIGEFNSHFEARYRSWCWKQRKCTVTLLLRPGTQGCLKNYSLCNVLVKTRTAQCRYL